MSNRRWKDTKDYPLSNARGQRNESKAMRAHVTIYPLDASGSAQISAPHYPTITFSPPLDLYLYPLLKRSSQSFP